MIEFFVISLTSSSDISFSFSKEDILLNSRLNSQKKYFFHLLLKVNLMEQMDQIKNLQKLPLIQKSILATIIEDPVDDNPFLMF